MDILQRRFVRVAAGPVAGCHRRSRSRPCTGTRTMSPFKWIHYYFQPLFYRLSGLVVNWVERLIPLTPLQSNLGRCCLCALSAR